MYHFVNCATSQLQALDICANHYHDGIILLLRMPESMSEVISTGDH